MSVEQSRTLGTIEESGLSDVQPSRSPSDMGTDSHPQSRDSAHEEQEDSDDEPFVYPGSSEPHTEDVLAHSAASAEEPPIVPAQGPVARPIASPEQLEEIYAAAAAGDLFTLQTLFQSALANGDLEAFALANSATSRTGLTPLHAAASRGHSEIVQWLIENCGAMPDLEDKEGETALHKAALNGHLNAIEFLLGRLHTNKADAHAQDGDGWTALHNACSKGYLDIVRYLCENGRAGEIMNHENNVITRGVDRKSKGGWTPLMNAASKGHLPVVLYLLTKQHANPLVRNNWGETAYDIAAAVFEVWICEVLQKAEAERWRHSPATYDPLAVHMTVPLILHENQHLDVRLRTLATSAGRPRFTTSGLGRKGRRAPFELRLPSDENGNKREIPAWRSDVQLPLREDPFTFPVPKAPRGPSSGGEGAERSHFWLSDWTMDLTHPRVDVNEGWQYARSFDDPDEQWASEPPPPLERILSGGASVLTPALTGAGGPSTSNASTSTGRGRSGNGGAVARVSDHIPATSWVRRRRWVRVMRRRLDIPPLTFLEPDGGRYYLSTDGELILAHGHEGTIVGGDGVGSYGSDGGQEMGVMNTGFGAHSQDYVSRARYLAGTQRGTDALSNDAEGNLSRADLKRSIGRLERAVLELRSGILGDEDAERRTQAEVLLNAYNRELERLRQRVGVAATFSGINEADEEEDNSSSDESFHYPTAPSPTSTARPASIRSHTTSDYFNFGASTSRAPSTRTGTVDLTPQLSQAPEFRVPTHEAPQKVTPRWTPPAPHSMHPVWERDGAAPDCRNCKRRFTFLLRKHHCRKCGKIFCDRCSSHRTLLDPSDVVQDPSYSDAFMYPSTVHRVCDTCYEQVTANVPGRFQGVGAGSLERIVVESTSLLRVPRNRQETASQISDLADCPVCNQNLAELGPPAVQQAHVKICLDSPSEGLGVHQAGRYLVYKLPAESALIGVECVICLEEFVKNTDVARLSCFCTFHNTCLSAWLQRGHNCPVHARDT